jgi:hypothetical protein
MNGVHVQRVIRSFLDLSISISIECLTQEISMSYRRWKPLFSERWDSIDQAFEICNPEGPAFVPERLRATVICPLCQHP